MAVNFEEYLQSKKIDSAAFRQHESALWESWRIEFEKLSPVSFTSQKLYLINPIRRRFQLQPGSGPVVEQIAVSKINPAVAESAPKAAPARPVVRPKPKMN